MLDLVLQYMRIRNKKRVAKTISSSFFYLFYCNLFNFRHSHTIKFITVHHSNFKMSTMAHCANCHIKYRQNLFSSVHSWFFYLLLDLLIFFAPQALPILVNTFGLSEYFLVSLKFKNIHIFAIFYLKLIKHIFLFGFRID